MIALDSSAIVAIALREAEAQAFLEVVAGADCIIGRPTVLETHMVLRERAGQAGVDVLDRLLARSRTVLLDFDEAHMSLARSAFDRYGKGRNHPARLNFGDCMAYAVAKTLPAPLLFRGGDFATTEIVLALP